MNNKFDNYPKTDMYKISDTVPLGHRYVLTNKHMNHAKKTNSSVISPATIVELEAVAGPSCGSYRCNKYYKQHEHALVVDVHYNGKLHEAPGLAKYLESCRKQAEKDGMSGFVYNQISD